MTRLFKQLDRILRGEATKPDQIAGGSLSFSARSLLVLIVLLGAVYGACMGAFAITGQEVAIAEQDRSRWMQIPASMLKVPLLFILTLIVTLPSLYVFNALVGSRLAWLSVLRLLTAAVAVMLAVLASLGPIVAFFSVSTTSYPFMLLLNVTMFTVAGVLGLKFLVRTLHRLTLAIEEESKSNVVETGVANRVDESTPPVMPPPIPTGALTPAVRPPGRNVRVVFRLWLIVFSLVGAQMGWVLRPFVGSPDKPFEWVRKREGNFFQAVTATAISLFSPEPVKRWPVERDQQPSR